MAKVCWLANQFQYYCSSNSSAFGPSVVKSGIKKMVWQSPKFLLGPPIGLPSMGACFRDLLVSCMSMNMEYHVNHIKVLVFPMMAATSWSPVTKGNQKQK
jgi:hypothetical protein